MLSRCFLDFHVGVGAFVIGLSQISSFSSFFSLDILCGSDYHTNAKKKNRYITKKIFSFPSTPDIGNLEFSLYSDMLSKEFAYQM